MIKINYKKGRFKFMEQNKIITIIKRISKQNPHKGQFILSEPFVCLVNSYYYVKPGEDSNQFFRDIEYMIAESYRLSKLQHNEQNGNDSFALTLQSTAAQLSVSLINESFNEKYFESQINRIDIEDLDDKELLKKYLNLLSKKQLKQFLALGDQLFTINDTEYESERQHFNDECRKVDMSIPSIHNNYKDYIKFEWENPLYYYDYLSKDTIVEILLEHRETDLDLAVFTAKALFHSDINFTCNCLNLLFYFQEYWGNKILDPLSLEEVKIENKLIFNK